MYLALGGSRWSDGRDDHSLQPASGQPARLRRIISFCRTFWFDALLEGKRATLRFLGVDYPLALQMGENELIVEVDSPKDLVEIRPHAKTLLMWQQS
jgi:hypothetical protein